MAVYATQDDVLARAGRFAGLFSVAGKRPNLADIDALLLTISAQVDGEIRTAGYDPASLTDDLIESLRDAVAWAALIRALPEASPGDDAINATIERGKAIVSSSGFPTLAEGSTNLLTAIGAVAELEAGQGGGGPGTSAGSFWDSLPADWLDIGGRLARQPDVTLANGEIPGDWIDVAGAEPQFRRGQSC